MKNILIKIYNFFKNKGYEKEVFLIMFIFTCISSFIILGYINQFGTTFQQGILFMGECIGKLLNLIAKIDSKSPGLLSLLGALIGFLGGLLVFYLQGSYQYRQDKKRLMLLLIYIYEKLSKLYISDINNELMIKLKEYNSSPHKFKQTYGESNQYDSLKYMCDRFLNIYSNIIYDNDWRRLIVTIKNIDDLNFLLELFINLESKHIYTKDEFQNEKRKIRDILTSNGYCKEIIFIDNKINKNNTSYNNTVYSDAL